MVPAAALAAGLALLTPMALRRRASTSASGRATGYHKGFTGRARPVMTAAEAFDLALLPEATVGQEITAAPLDEAVTAGTAGMIAHHRQPVHVYAEPDGAVIAWLSPQVLGSDVWLPVIDQQPGWMRVLLPSRPNAATGWITTAELALTHTPHEIRVHRRSSRLQLFTSGRLAGSWRVSAATDPALPPAGRTFLLTVIPGAEPAAAFLALGQHGPAVPTCTGSAGTVAIHALPVEPDDDRSCHACLRVPADAIATLARIPAGSLVRIYR
ncbi:L,D-transpeptidase [Actinoplanes sp. HUAS TT8]|uniref:L,D-transpeptidase n=1 Tax=Actinoplanes sp. HUAS TT8 TaxID=3447453 RepID=UPI003F522CE6